MLTQYNLSSNVQQIRSWFPSFERGKEIQMGILPLFHSFGMTAVMNLSMWMGWNIILIPRPEPMAIFEGINQYKPTFMAAVPTMFVGLLSHPDLKEV